MFKYKKEYDIFISFKNISPDKNLARLLYYYLSHEGLKVFFSPITLRDLGRDDWNDEIKKAIITSKIFIALGSKKEHMEAKWTQRERTSFLALKDIDSFRVIYSYIDSPLNINDLPDDLEKFECFKANDLENERLLNYIKNHLFKQKKKSLLTCDFLRGLLVGTYFLLAIYLIVDSQSKNNKIEKYEKFLDNPIIQKFLFEEEHYTKENYVEDKEKYKYFYPK